MLTSGCGLSRRGHGIFLNSDQNLEQLLAVYPKSSAKFLLSTTNWPFPFSVFNQYFEYDSVNLKLY